MLQIIIRKFQGDCDPQILVLIIKKIKNKKKKTPQPNQDNFKPFQNPIFFSNFIFKAKASISTKIHTGV